MSIERELIKDTPFTMVGTKEHGYWLAMGRHRISKAYKTKQEALIYLRGKDWTLLTSVIIAMISDRTMIDEGYKRQREEQMGVQLNNQ